MIVCCCNAFNDRAVDAAIAGGARSVGQVYKAIGVTPRCGACKDVIRGQITDRLGSLGGSLLPGPMSATATASAA